MKKTFSFLLVMGVLAALYALWPQDRSHRARPYRIAAVTLTDVDRVTFTSFKEGLLKRGYGPQAERPATYLFLNATGNLDLLPQLVQKAVDFQPDLIFVSSTPATQEVQKATRATRIPVIFAPVNDPLAAKIVKSIRQPGGHITGIRLSPSDSLRLQQFLQIIPDCRCLFLPFHPDDESATASAEEIMTAANKIGINILLYKISNDQDLQNALTALPSRADGIILPRDSRVEARISEWVDLSLRSKIPLCAPSRQQAEQGALFSYGFSHGQIGEQAARLADQILRGAQAGSLPVEAAENFSYLNISTAHRLGLNPSDKSLRQINEIIR